MNAEGTSRKASHLWATSRALASCTPPKRGQIGGIVETNSERFAEALGRLYRVAVEADPNSDSAVLRRVFIEAVEKELALATGQFS